MSQYITLANGSGAATVIDISEENGFILYDRIQKIRSVITKYGEENFYLAFSGGKDSTCLSALVDMAVPQNKIPRVYINTGIELNMIADFVKLSAKHDERVVIISPSVPIKPTLERVGYPFKSKAHSHMCDRYRRISSCPSVQSYLGNGKWPRSMCCPKMLKYQFEEGFELKISDRCCVEMKEKPLERWSREYNKPYALIGIMPDEGGRRKNATCLRFRGRKLAAFQPLTVVDKKWEDWFINEYHIKICELYTHYGQLRSGCKGCPFSLHLQEELDMLEKYFPSERRQCEIIWEPVYAEYRRLGYRLKK